MRRAAKVDANQREIVSALVKAGASVTSLAPVGDGVPDLLVSYRRQWHLIEVKDGSKPPSQRKLTPDQQAWHARQNAPVHVVNTVDEALQVIGAVSGAGSRWALENVS